MAGIISAMVLKNDEKNFVIVSPALLCFGAAVVAFLLDLERIQVVSLYRQTQPLPSSGKSLFLLLLLRGLGRSPKERAVRPSGRVRRRGHYTKRVVTRV